ncbi:carbon-nitrogen hydrolase family protein [Streptomyces sp. me109]|uniref:carbon-nitrogen hydrolase family protein n=1 Tax=Streptomyces sp. me109 TaxID=1827853 RepID=UPI0011CE9E12|nr:carbon-nitrogen hydrolase family protein [Streptomyces sp. me109]TXS64419.1 carbon-nitrogen hydrolase family protein [Streptomyces sp. me109]
MARPLPLILAQAPGRPADDLAGFATDVERRVKLHAHARGALVVYPELHLGESAPGVPDVPEEGAEPLDGKRDAAFAELAGDLGIWLVPGSVYERGTGDRVHNTTPVYSPQGERLGAYRKICPWRPYETTTPGNRFEVVDLPGVGRIGLSICYDAWFPEISRHLAWMGAELIVNVVRTPTSDRAQEVVLNRANAITNQVFVASVNSAAPSGIGRSLVIDPQGTVRAETVDAGDSTLTDVIDLDEVSNVRRYGTAGLNRIWEQFRPGDPALELPLYGGRIDPATWNPTHTTEEPRC